MKVGKKWISPDMTTDQELASEAATRSSNDTSHQSQITSNANAISSEATDRENADIALQSNIDFKYNASNPNGYETPSQLNARDTNNRARANHSGTQLAATISDFFATVRSTVLTGFSLATSTASILAAIGKLQAQLDARVYGQGFEDFLSTTPFTTSSGTNQQMYLFTTSSKVAGRYRVAIKWNFTTNTQSASARFHLRVGGTQIDGQTERELKDSTDDVIAIQFVYVTLAAGTHTIELLGNMEGSATLTVSLCRAEIWRVS